MNELVVYLGSLPPTAASFLGSLAGAGLGLVTGVLVVVLGALLNSHLNRRRDDRVRKTEVKALRQALSVELTTWKEAFERNINSIRAEVKETDHGILLIPDSSEDETIYKMAKTHLFLLEPPALKKVMFVYLTSTTYYDTLMIIAQGKTEKSTAGRSYIALPRKNVHAFLQMTESFVEKIDLALVELERI